MSRDKSRERSWNRLRRSPSSAFDSPRPRINRHGVNRRHLKKRRAASPVRPSRHGMRRRSPDPKRPRAGFRARLKNHRRAARLRRDPRSRRAASTCRPGVKTLRAALRMEIERRRTSRRVPRHALRNRRVASRRRLSRRAMRCRRGGSRPHAALHPGEIKRRPSVFRNRAARRRPLPGRRVGRRADRQNRKGKSLLAVPPGPPGCWA